MHDLIGQRLGDFEIEREIGRGGMGIVYEARQVSLNRRVALKILSNGLGLTSKAVQRFQREAEAAAKLHHTNIVPVYATGEENGIHFYVMELIDGLSLDKVVRQMRTCANSQQPTPTNSKSPADFSYDPAQTGPFVEGASLGGTTPALGSSSLVSGSGYFDTVARMIAEVADALEYAHREGVIHRDIKPSNLLLSSADRLHVNDFGLARILEQPGMTVTGEFLGTPAYMSPEQITAGRTPLDHRSDIYSLGATLFELMTLQPPFRGKTQEQILAQILHKEPIPPRKINPRMSLDLETICLKALEKDPDRRYQTAGAMADDLRRYVNRFAILAKRVGPVGRLVKWIRRNPTVSASLGGLIVAVFAAIALAFTVYRTEQERRLEREVAAERLRDEEERGRQLLLDEKIRNTYLVAASGDLHKTDEAIKEIESLGGSTGQVRLLRGVAAYFRQDTETAVSELEQATKLLPENVAARALLAIAYADYGQANRSEPVYQELKHLTPVSAEDLLFKGYSYLIVDPLAGLPELNEGIRRHDSPLGRALRSLMWTSHAERSGNLESAEKALADAAVARGMLPDNQFVIYVHLYARVMAAALYEEAHKLEERSSILRQAAQDVQALEPSIGRPATVWMIWQYYMDVGNTDKALDMTRRSFRQSQGSMPALYCATSLYLRGEFEEALHYLDHRQPQDVAGDVTRLFVLAELPNGPSRMREELDRFTRKHTRTPSYPLLLLGGKSEAQEVIRVAPLRSFSQEMEKNEIAMRKFSNGEISDDVYLASVAGSRMEEIRAHFVVGLFRLAEGDRQAAKNHFAKAVQLHAPSSFQGGWSLMFLSRLQTDPNWPRWIPKK